MKKANVSPKPLTNVEKIKQCSLRNEFCKPAENIADWEYMYFMGLRVNTKK